LAQLGEEPDAAERQLAHWRFHPALAREAVAWAWDRHRQAQVAAAAQRAAPSQTDPVEARVRRVAELRAGLRPADGDR
jgi:hypothetical protein